MQPLCRLFHPASKGIWFVKKKAASRPRKSRRRRGFSLSKKLFHPLAFGLLLAFAIGFALVALNIHHMAPHRPVVVQTVPPSIKLEDIIAKASNSGDSDAPTPLLQYEEPAAMLVPPVPVPLVPPKPTGHKLIAIVIDDVGPDYRGAKAAISLPPQITLAFLPYAEKLDSLTEEAKAQGHELLVHMPMEPEDRTHNNPGKNALTVGLSQTDVQQRVAAALDAIPGVVGLNNHMGSRFTENRAGMEPVLAELARRNLLFLDSRTTPKSVGASLAMQYHLRFVGRDVFLDNTIESSAIRHQLGEVERIARQRGQAVAIGHPHRETLDALRAWIPQAKAEGFEFVPISRLAVPQ